MPKQKPKPGRPTKPKTRSQQREKPAESQASEAITVAWTVSVTMVLVCNVAAALAHLLARFAPEVRGAATFKELLLFSAAAIGAGSLLLLPVVLRVRRTLPPTGFTVFAVCAAVAPMLALLVRTLR
jgi:hypothetical protein